MEEEEEEEEKGGGERERKRVFILVNNVGDVVGHISIFPNTHTHIVLVTVVCVLRR